jgi:hypothetical protein
MDHYKRNKRWALIKDDRFYLARIVLVDHNHEYSLRRTFQMDYAAIASTIISALSPFAVKGIEKIVEKSAEEGFNQRRAIFDRVKELFGYDEPILLNLLQDAKSNPEKKGEFKGELKAHLQSHPDIALQLQELLKELPQQIQSTENYQDFGKNNEDVGILAGKLEAQKVIGKKKQ